MMVPVGEESTIQGWVSPEFGKHLAEYPIWSYTAEFEHEGSIYRARLSLDDVSSAPGEEMMIVILLTAKPIRVKGPNT